MKRELVLLMLMITSFALHAEDVLQIIPLKTTAGNTSTTAKGLEVSLSNSSFDVANLQFDILLPEGMELAGNSSFTTRVPYTSIEDEDDEGETVYIKKYDFSYQTNVQASGYTRFMFIPGGEMRPIPSGEGTIMKLRYRTASTMSPGIYPILMTNIKLVKSVTESITIPSTSSYVIIGDPSSSDVDFSTLTGYVPSFVVEQLNAEIAANENLTIVDLSGATGLGADLETPDNVVSVVGTKGTLKREFTATYWSTVCLPFALSADQVTALKGEGVEIEAFTAFDEAAGTVTFEPVTAMDANTPYIVKSESTQSPFTNLANVQLSTAEMNNVVVGKMTFMGTFEKQTLNSSTNTIYYAYNASDGNFVRIGSNATVPPFRAYLKLDNSAGARSFIVNHGDGEATGISTQLQGYSKTGGRYNLLGMPQAENSKVKGIYIQNGQKIVVR